MIKLLIVLLVILLPISFALIISGIKESRKKNDYIQITFQQFYDVYKATKRSRWRLGKNYVYYFKRSECGIGCYQSEFIYFKTIFDKIKYRIFKKVTDWKEKKYEQQKKQSILSAKTAEMMRVWSEDIESYKLESIKELQSMIDENNKKVDEYKKRVEELKHETEKF